MGGIALGAWSTSITGNDVAADLAYEYRVAFLRFTPDEAVARLDDYVVKNFGGSEDDCWPDYVYSLALFMWKHGILTEAIKRRALTMIDSGVGLDLYDASQLKKRNKVLAELVGKLSAPQPEAKRIQLRWNTKPVFRVGDVLALQLHTAETPYFPHALLTEPQFRACDGYWIMLRKMKDHISCHSAIDPSVQDIWPVFELYDYLSPEIPTPEALSECRVCKRFFSNGTMRPYTKHNVKIIANNLTGITENEADTFHGVFFENSDEEVLLDMLGEPQITAEDVIENIAPRVIDLANRRKDA